MKQIVAVAAVVALVGCGGSEKSAEEPGDDFEKLETDDGRSGDRRSSVPGMDDDDEDEDVEIEGLRGRLEMYDIERGLKPHSEALSACFESRAKRQKYIGGKVELGYRVARDGSVKLAKMNKSDLGVWEIEKCLLDVARSMTFAKPKGGEAEFSVPLEFSGRGRARWWGDDQTAEEVGVKLVDLEACAEDTEVSAPSEVYITLYVGPRGVVKSSGFASKEELPEQWTVCALEKIAAWTFSDPRGTVAKLSFLYGGG